MSCWAPRVGYTPHPRPMDPMDPSEVREEETETTEDNSDGGKNLSVEGKDVP